MNQKVKNLIQKLGEAIHESVSESENIAGVVRNIREQGFDVLLMLEATIGLNEVDDDDTEPAQPLRLTAGGKRPENVFVERLVVPEIAQDQPAGRFRPRNRHPVTSQ